MAKQGKEPGMIGMVCGVFTGPLKFWAWFGFLLTLIFAIGFFYSGWRFWIAESVNDHFHWGVATIILALLVAMMKLWFWMQMMQNQIIRALKK